MGQRGGEEIRGDLITLQLPEGRLWRGEPVLQGNNDRTAKLARLLKSSVSEKAFTTQNILQYSAPKMHFYRIHASRSIST